VTCDPNSGNSDAHRPSDRNPCCALECSVISESGIENAEACQPIRRLPMLEHKSRIANFPQPNKLKNALA